TCCRNSHQTPSPSLARRVVIDQLKSWNIGDKIRIPRAMTFDYSAFATEVPFLATEAIGKCEGIVEHEIHISKTVDHNGRIRQGDESRRLITLNVEMLAPRVQRR